mmetsp:Transcript_16346/g.49018  ORF Transcript_16346/g.49018 Transcript_16346/m.49018 type:complete len:229 (+) Transcript_16346:460-1146(+)
MVDSCPTACPRKIGPPCRVACAASLGSCRRCGALGTSRNTTDPCGLGRRPVDRDSSSAERSCCVCCGSLCTDAATAVGCSRGGRDESERARWSGATPCASPEHGSARCAGSAGAKAHPAAGVPLRPGAGGCAGGAASDVVAAAGRTGNPHAAPLRRRYYACLRSLEGTHRCGGRGGGLLAQDAAAEANPAGPGTARRRGNTALRGQPEPRQRGIVPTDHPQVPAAGRR